MQLAATKGLDGNKFGLANIVWGALEKISAKQLNRDEIDEGAEHKVSLNIEGSVDSHHFSESIESVVTVGHSKEKSISQVPELSKLIAFILSKLNANTRSKILSDLPSDFANNGSAIPSVDDTLTEQVKQMLKSVRSKKVITSRGPIGCKYQLQSSI